MPTKGGTVPSTAYGLNQAVWDAQMNTPALVGLLSQAGVGMMRYPGGSYSDAYNWRTNTVAGGYVAPGTGFDSFMSTVKAVGAQAILTANYGSGTPQEAADWVQYANITKGYHDQYWEIGNELYGNGYYGYDWETDNHASSGHLRPERHPVRERDEGRRPDDQDRRGPHPAGQLARQRRRVRRHAGLEPGGAVRGRLCRSTS